MKSFLTLRLISGLVGSATAQAPSSGARFETVSIKAFSGEEPRGGRTLGDGTRIMTGFTIRQFILTASPVPARQVRGLLDWALRDRYNITLKPPAGSSRDQQSVMMRNMFADRMKLVGHVEDEEQATFALIIGTPDKSLGPNLKPTTRNCPMPAPEGPSVQPPPGGFDRCGMQVGPARSKPKAACSMDLLARSADSPEARSSTRPASRAATTSRYATPKLVRTRPPRTRRPSRRPSWSSLA